ncbi:uncharacterized protein METZ01_LOCUS347582, partial [marine metagenome]
MVGTTAPAVRVGPIPYSQLPALLAFPNFKTMMRIRSSLEIHCQRLFRNILHRIGLVLKTHGKPSPITPENQQTFLGQKAERSLNPDSVIAQDIEGTTIHGLGVRERGWIKVYH